MSDDPTVERLGLSTSASSNQTHDHRGVSLVVPIEVTLPGSGVATPSMERLACWPTVAAAPSSGSTTSVTSSATRARPPHTRCQPRPRWSVLARRRAAWIWKRSQGSGEPAEQLGQEEDQPEQRDDRTGGVSDCGAESEPDEPDHRDLDSRSE
jgi:hypothetical protein